MEDAVFSPNTMLGTTPGPFMDMDFMDELLLEGCWLETMSGSDFLHQTPSIHTSMSDPLLPWPSCQDNNNNTDSNHQPSSLLETSLITANTQSCTPSVCNIAMMQNNPAEPNELRRRWWIGPMMNSGPATSMTERLIKALGYIQDLTKDKDVLIQLWVPVSRGGKQVLTTSNQPYALDSSSRRLLGYRDISVNYQFSAEENSEEMMGMPSRVFLRKVPEWTPDVRFFRSEEYPRVSHAQQFDVRGTLALPVFEQGSRNCLGVIEVVMTTQKVKYRPEIESVCKALQAVDLRSSEIFSSHNVETRSESYEAALSEIKEVLKSACETHGLPLAQAWVPCIVQGKGGCRHSDENYSHCVSTVDVSCHVSDPRVQAFHEACSEHHLLKGQGIVGRAFLTNQPCFSPDVTSIAKTEYPLSHHARMFGLCAAVAIRLRSVYTGPADFVLEFFLPMECKDLEQQKKMLTSLSTVIQQVCRNLRVVTEEELNAVPCTPSNEEKTVDRSSEEKKDSSWTEFISEGEQNMGGIPSEKIFEFGQQQQQHENGEDCLVFEEGGSPSAGPTKSGDKKRAKAEKTITLQILRKYFAGSLKDAAKSLGVCPTTLKRICRQHGIMRWPSRKIRKVGHSLQKLQLVIDSVQGTSGSLEIGSFYSNFPDLTSPTAGPTSSSKPTTTTTSDPPQNQIIPTTTTNTVQTVGVGPSSKSQSSSCSRSSSSSQCCSSGRQPLPSAWQSSTTIDDQMVSEQETDPSAKRIRSEAEFQSFSSPEEMVKTLAQSPSQRTLNDNRSNFEDRSFQDTILPLPNSGNSQEWEAMRVKVGFGDEIIRFRLQKNWGLNDLWQEIRRRFSVEDLEKYDLKYLDDDVEWVLLTCDADLEECVDICRSSRNSTIKLSLQLSHHHHHHHHYLGSSFGSSGPP